MANLSKEVNLHSNKKEELSASYISLVNKAEEAVKGSYSPYSGFAVGAAVLLKNGEIVTGANQENAAYPSGLCAERTALFYTGANYPDEDIVAIAIALGTPVNNIPFPCGSCLQVMSEYEDNQEADIDILLVHPVSGEVWISKGLNNLLPFAFKKKHLKK